MEILEGTASPDDWYIGSDHNPLPNPVGHTFPILTHDSNGQWSLIGTGFYISSDGLFVTAKHVIEEVLENSIQVKPIVILQLYSEIGPGLFGSQSSFLRPIIQCWLGKESDMALGIAATMINNESGNPLTHYSWKMSWNMPTQGSTVSTLAFPNHEFEQTETVQTLHSAPDAYMGIFEDANDYRDRVKIPFPYLQIGTRIHGGASGGPIFDHTGSVIGVNSTYIEPTGPGYGVQIRCLQNAFLENGMLIEETVPRRIEFHELVSSGAVEAVNFSIDAVPTQEGYIVYLDQVRVSAPRPNLSLTQYF